MTTDTPAPSPDRQSREVASVIDDLRESIAVNRTRVRRIGQIADSFGVVRRFDEPYDEFLERLLMKTNKKEI